MDTYKTVTIHTRSSYWSSKELNDEMIVDADDLAREITEQSNKLVKEGFEVDKVIPVTSGNTSSGTGYYYTESVIILAKRII
ncbi:MAG: hypothetical protein ACOC31_01930 [Bacteroidota bacterium]